MNKEVISDKQGIAIMVMFIIGTASIMARGIDAKQDLWLAIILAMFAAFPMAFTYAYLQYLFPGKDLFDMMKICFGKLIGKGIMLLYTFFLFHTGASVFMNFNHFIWTVSLLETPKIILFISMIILCIFSVKEGIEVIGRWAAFFIFILIGFIFILTLLLIPKMDIKNIQPFLSIGIKPVLKGTFSAFTFPFTQIVVFTMAFSNFKSKKSPFKVYIGSLFIGGMVILVSSLATMLVLGVNTATSVYYPAYTSATRVKIGEALQRLEIIIATAFSLGVFIKGSIYLLAACKGISKLFHYSDYRFIVIPVSLLMINLSYFHSESLMDYFDWILEGWIYYAFPFHVILPMIMLIIGEIKRRNEKIE